MAAMAHALPFCKQPEVFSKTNSLARCEITSRAFYRVNVVSRLSRSSSGLVRSWEGECQGNSLRQSTSLRLTRGTTSTQPSTRKRQVSSIHAALEDDWPYALAIGIAIASSAIPLVLPPRKKTEAGEDEETGAALGDPEVRYGAMTVIGFIPVFNWLTWIFAYLDTKEIRYLLYGLAYAAPYAKTGLSLSPDDSWLPLASVLLCGVHVQFDKFTEESDPIVSEVPSWAKNFSLPKLPQIQELPSPGKQNNKIEGDKNVNDDGDKHADEEAKIQMQMWDEKFKASREEKQPADERKQ